jgi:membrane-associated phospholipid phosphatase
LTEDVPAASLARIELRLGVAFWLVAATTAVLSSAGRTLLPFVAPVVVFLALWPLLRRRTWAPTVVDWLPFPFVVLTYAMLHAVIPACWTATIDPTLAAWDRAVLGADVGALFEPLASRPLTVVMSSSYTTYYMLALSLALFWWFRRRRTAFRELMAGEVGALFIGYLGYLFLPAVGPHAAAATASLPLDGDFIGGAIRSLNGAHGGHFPRDAFPSLHTANAVTILLVAWRHERRLLLVYGPLVAGIVTATMYLRYHYAVDVLAGAALAVAWQAAVPRLVSREPGVMTGPEREPPTICA